MNDIFQVVGALNLASSENRETSISSLILSTIYQNNEVNAIELQKFINKIFEITIQESEIERELNRLIEKGEVIKTNNKLILSLEQNNKLRIKDNEGRNKEDKRFFNFKKLVNVVSTIEISEVEHSKLWNTFQEYLISCFLDYGENAVQIFYPEYNKNRNETIYNDSLIKKALINIEKKFHGIFLKITEKYPDFIGSEELDYLDDLVNKTISFKSLGLTKELYDTFQSSNFIDWTILTDTNFLYSILDLHEHPEKRASKQLLNLIKDNDLKIKFRFLDCTLKELKNKRDEFLETIPKNKYQPSQIKAILKSEHIDRFSRSYFQNLLEDDDVLHPSEIIDIAELHLQAFNILIYRNKFDMLDEKYINSKIVEYQRYIIDKNIIRSEKREGKEIFRSDKQIWHDVYLREVIGFLRHQFVKKNPSFENAKYLGITLDKVLISYDNFDLRRNKVGQQIPAFLLPSFLLNKLIKTLPLETGDYKRAFISAVTSRVFTPEVKETQNALRIVKHLKRLGISDERLISNVLNNEFFFEKYSQIQINDNAAADELISTEIENLYRKVELEKKLKEKENIELLDSIRLRDFEKNKLSKELEKNKNENENNIKYNTLLLKELENAKTEIIALKKENETISLQKFQQILLNEEIQNDDINIENEIPKKIINSKNGLMDKIKNNKTWLIITVLLFVGLFFIFSSPGSKFNIGGIASGEQGVSKKNNKEELRNQRKCFVQGFIKINNKVPNSKDITLVRPEHSKNITSSLKSGGTFYFTDMPIPESGMIGIEVVLTNGTTVSSLVPFKEPDEKNLSLLNEILFEGKYDSKQILKSLTVVNNVQQSTQIGNGNSANQSN